MTATSEIRFGADGTAKVQSYVRLTDSTWIRCCTYPDAAPILTIQDGSAEITITNPGRGEVTKDDVRFGRQLTGTRSPCPSGGRRSTRPRPSSPSPSSCTGSSPGWSG
jgi:hypothetical protein